jgi:hypothetical protein
VRAVYYNILNVFVFNVLIIFYISPGGELKPEEDYVEGLKRLLNEVS